MAEFDPESARGHESAPEEQIAPAVQSPAVGTPLLKRAKITVPLLDEQESGTPASAKSRITRPLAPANTGISTVTAKLPSFSLNAKITPPLALAETESNALAEVPGKVTSDATARTFENVAGNVPAETPGETASDTSAQAHEEATVDAQDGTPEEVAGNTLAQVILEAMSDVPTQAFGESKNDALAGVPAEDANDALVGAPAEVATTVPIGENRAAQPTTHLQEVSQPVLSTPLPATLQPVPTTPVPPLLAQASVPPVSRPTRWQQARMTLAVPSHAGMSQRRLRRLYRLQYFSRKHLRRARAHDRLKSRRLWTTIWTTLTSLLLLFLLLIGATGYIAYNFITTTQRAYASQVLTLRDLLPPDNLKIYDSQGNLIDQMTDQGIHTEVPYTQIAPAVVDATVAIEDRTFWQNAGVDITGILRAALADLESGQTLQGGSTITQQLIKLLVVGNSGDVMRKLSEMVLAPQVNSHYSKQDIMEMYLNTIYYGHQAYGIDAAATVYFGLVDKQGQSAASQLDLAQSAFLAGLPRNASLYDPATNPISASNRFYTVLQAMVAQHYITQVQAQAAYQEGQSPTFFQSSPTLQDQAPHFDDYVLSQLEQMYHLSRAKLSRSGLVVYTTVNVALQKQILTVMQQHIAEIRDAHHVTNAAEVLIDFHTGAIISMLGSIDYNNPAIDGQFNVALAYRQPGSSFKPYVYVTAFAQGASPAQAVDDASTTFNVPDSNPPTYTPSNYDHHFHGHMTLRCALQNSLNVPAVRVLQHVGVDNAMATAQAMGITSYEGTPGLSLVLGGLDVRLLDHTSAMGVFANNGVRQPYYSISKIVQGTTGKVIFQHQMTPGTQVISPQLAYMMTSVLSDNTSRIPEFFDCNVLQLYANSQQDCYEGNRGVVRPAAAKTGTTQDFRDNWTEGYTTDYVMGVWAGNDDNSPMINVTGVQGATPIWHDAMLLAEQGHPIQDFQNPGGLQRATVTYPDGVTSTDWFLPGTVPQDEKQTPTPEQDQNDQPATTTPYCSTFSYAFQPPANGGIPTNGEWW